MTLQWPVGKMEVLLFDTEYAAIPTAEPIYALSWKTSRFQNKVSSWEVVLPIDTGLIGGVPLHRSIRRGWHVTLHTDEQDFVTYGVVQDRAYLTAGGGTVLRLQGGSRNLHLTDRSTLTGLEYTGQTGQAIGEDLVTGVIGPGGTLYGPGDLTAVPTIRFNDITRFEALRKVAEVSRCAIRESWDADLPEFTRIDNPPNGFDVTLQKIPYFDPLAEYGGTTGVIADPPAVSFRGHDIVNRIIPIGSDTPDGPLTLASASVSAPYAVLSAVGPNGQTYYYIEDADSIARYGLVETSLVRTDVKNPSDDAGTRTAAANVLYAIAAGLLLKRKSEIMIVDIPVANGVEIWAQPGDRIRLTYTGEVLIYA